MAVTNKVLLTVIRLRLNECMPCHYGEPTTECDDAVHSLLVQVRDIIQGAIYPLTDGDWEAINGMD